MESNKEKTVVLSNQTNINSNSTSDSEDFKFIDYSSFEKINTLCNEVGIEAFKAYWKDKNIYVTLKKIQSQYLENAKLFHKLNYHRNILPIFGYSKEPNSENYLLVTQYADGGNLRYYLREVRPNLTWDEKIKLAIDVTSGLQCIHGHDIVHLSLHPKNVFIHNNRLLIGDLGLSDTMSDDSLFENIDILPYIEPNFVTNLSYPRDKKSDVYSLGFILYEISSGKTPFASVLHHYDLSKKILSGIRENPTAGTPIEYIDLYELCWDNDPTIRPSASDALAKLSRMNLSPVHEDIIISTPKININVKNNENEKITYDNNNETLSESSTRNPHDSITLDFSGGMDSGFGLRQQAPNDGQKERKCQVIPCLPKCRITFGAFLCCMCIILVVACLMLFFLISLLKMKKK